ncbi:inactive rhomboid protein 1-like [Dorcoceras hygrometricum]|uniref:Inactive rhomboid protein 1-like n=1 Tax=Dorcoceras hygrometricum TaxID=472368 RepID=A0A2Z7B013_9LAMI|nr:inactive rhomboid protein 1-like [Dorcoceras hygrometricum]
MRHRIAYSDLALVSEICLAGVSKCELLLEEVSDVQWSRVVHGREQIVFSNLISLIFIPITLDSYCSPKPYFRRLPSFYAVVWSNLVALSSSSLGLSIDTSLETGVVGFEEREVVTVFVCLRDC